MAGETAGTARGMAGTARGSTHRTARGDARRELLRNAAAQVLNEQGFAALTHRAVAARAGIPLASTTYYFASVEDLAEQALQRAVDDWLAGSEAALAALPASLTSRPATARALLVVVAGGVTEPAELVSMYERYLEAGRTPHLRPIVVAFNADLVRRVAVVLGRAGRTPDTAQLVLATVDGLLLTALSEGSEQPAADVVPALSRLVGLLARS